MGRGNHLEFHRPFVVSGRYIYCRLHTMFNPSNLLQLCSGDRFENQGRTHPIMAYPGQRGGFGRSGSTNMSSARWFTAASYDRCTADRGHETYMSRVGANASVVFAWILLVR